MSNDLSNGPSRGILIAAVMFVFALWVGTICIVPLVDSANDRGTFGDMFGAVNALFTGLAFAFVVYGLAVQRHEVKLLTEELQGTKHLATEQQKLAKIQIFAQQKQQFEATFFNLLRVFNDLVAAIGTGRGENAHTGKVALSKLLAKVSENRDINRFSGVDAYNLDVIAGYDQVYELHSSVLGHYFRTLYNLFKFIDRSALEPDEKRIYTNLIRAQLSDDEAMLLFINGLTERGRKFKPYLEKYAVLKNVNQNNEFFTRSEKKGEYAPSAFD